MVNLNLFPTELSIRELREADKLRAEISAGFGFESTEAQATVSGLVATLMRQGVYYFDDRGDGWEVRMRTYPIHVLGATADRLGEISVVITEEVSKQLPVGMVAALDQVAAQSVDQI